MLRLRSSCALALLVFLCGAPSSAQQTADRIPVEATSPDAVSPVSFTGYGCGPSSNCEAGGGLLAGMTTRPRGRLFVGGEYLYAQTAFSDAPLIATTNLSGVTGVTFNQFDFDSEASYRWYAGFRDECCGGEWRISGTNLSSDAREGIEIEVGDDPFQTPFFILDGTTFGEGGPAIAPGGTPIPPFDAGGVAGTLLTLGASVDTDYWDFAFSKTITLGSLGGCDPCGDACGDCCGDCCDCGPRCPAWDITWTGGVRIADVEWRRFGAADVPLLGGGTSFVGATQVQDFSGAGPRVGLKGRRYFGQSGMLSAYVDGNISLLLGDVEFSQTSVNSGVITRETADFTRVIPVTDIEAGGALFLSRRLVLEGGYFFQAWHDLGMGAEIEVTDGATAGNDLRFDDANILGWHGFFARIEATF